ncbi:MAG TPA: helix-turn-helix domain-containing protein [Candidatus Blautia intestinigallinarum]|nr:helix-turn-helix domain-containing protein [Candidatus Blautia intestinigallinarum]
MKKQTFGSMIAEFRKKKGMTQVELAEKMGVTDKAVSKWERDLSFPDVNTIPRLAEIFNVTVDELMQVKTDTKESRTTENISDIINIALKSISLAMGVAVVVLSFINEIETKNAIGMLGLGLACLAISQFSSNKTNTKS